MRIDVDMVTVTPSFALIVAMLLIAVAGVSFIAWRAPIWNLLRGSIVHVLGTAGKPFDRLGDPVVAMIGGLYVLFAVAVLAGAWDALRTQMPEALARTPEGVLLVASACIYGFGIVAVLLVPVILRRTTITRAAAVTVTVGIYVLLVASAATVAAIVMGSVHM